MEYLHSLLKFAVNMGASDIHVNPGHHATIRISGELFPVQVDPPTKEQVEEIVRHMLPKHLEARLEREKRLDTLRGELLTERVCDFLLEKAKVTKVEPKVGETYELQGFDHGQMPEPANPLLLRFIKKNTK